MDNRENLIGIVETFFRWKKPILGLCLIAGIGSVIITLTLPNYYQSFTTYYVASPDQIMPDPVGNRLKEKELYGTSEDRDRNMSIAQSSELVNFMIDSFNLYEHYEIDSTNEKSASKVRKRFLKLYNVEQTKYDAIELSIEDTDRILAKDMTIAAREKIEDISVQIVKESFQKSLRNTRSNIDSKEVKLQILGDSLQRIREKYGIYNILSQSEFLSAQITSAEADLALNKAKLASLKSAKGIPRDTINFIIAQVAGLEKGLEKSKESMQLFNQGMSSVISLERAYSDGIKQLSLDKEQFKQNEAAFNSKNPPMIFLVEDATIPLEKSRPKRSIICIMSVLIAFILGLTAALLLDMYKDVNWKEIVNAQ